MPTPIRMSRKIFNYFSGVKMGPEIQRLQGVLPTARRRRIHRQRLTSRLPRKANGAQLAVFSNRGERMDADISGFLHLCLLRNLWLTFLPHLRGF